MNLNYNFFAGNDPFPQPYLKVCLKNPEVELIIKGELSIGGDIFYASLSDVNSSSFLSQNEKKDLRTELENRTRNEKVKILFDI